MLYPEARIGVVVEVVVMEEWWRGLGAK